MTYCREAYLVKRISFQVFSASHFTYDERFILSWSGC
jgi:hypothetical protein